MESEDINFEAVTISSKEDFDLGFRSGVNFSSYLAGHFIEMAQGEINSGVKRGKKERKSVEAMIASLFVFSEILAEKSKEYESLAGLHWTVDLMQAYINGDVEALQAAAAKDRADVSH